MLGKRAILDEMEKGHIIIDPFNELQLGPNSYDVRLGDWIFYQRAVTGHTLSEKAHYVDITKDTIWDTYPYNMLKWDGGFKISAGGYVLGTTLEVVGGYSNISTLLKTRSTIARQGLQVCSSAGFGDVGYCNYWTLEIKNDSDHNLWIPHGIRIAQICFFRVEGAETEYEGAYKQQETWHPSQMLPQLGKGRF